MVEAKDPEWGGKDKLRSKASVADRHRRAEPSDRRETRKALSVFLDEEISKKKHESLWTKVYNVNRRGQCSHGKTEQQRPGSDFRKSHGLNQRWWTGSWARSFTYRQRQARDIRIGPG